MSQKIQCSLLVALSGDKVKDISMTQSKLDWKERFAEATRVQKNSGNPYWPDWQAVEDFISSELQTQKKQLLEKLLQELPELEWRSDETSFQEGYRKGCNRGINLIRKEMT